MENVPREARGIGQCRVLNGVSTAVLGIGLIGLALLILLSSAKSEARDDFDVVFADRFSTRPTEDNASARRPLLVEAVASASDTVTLSWLPAQHEETRPEDILYVVHRGDEAGFTPSATTEISSHFGLLSTEIGDLAPGDEFFVKVEAFGQEAAWLGWSNELQAHVPTLVAELVDDLRFLVLDESNATNLIVLSDRIQFQRLDPEMEFPAPGGLVISTFADGFARIVTATDVDGDNVTVHTEQDPAHFNEVFGQIDLRNAFMLANLPEEGATGDSSMRLSSQTTRSGTQLRRAEWQRTGLMLEQQVAQSLSIDLKPIRQAGDRANELGPTETEVFGNRLRLQHPAFAAVSPDNSLDIIVIADRVGSELDFEVKSLELDELTAPSGKTLPPHNWVLDQDDATTKQLRLRVEPQRVHVDDRARPYIATFTARGEKTDCFWFCSTRASIEVPIYIGVEQIEENQEPFSVGDESTVRFHGEVLMELSPDIRFDAQLSGARLQEADFIMVIDPAMIRLIGTIDANLEEQSSGSAQLLQKRFVKVIPVMGVPVVVTGTFALDGEFTAHASAEMGLTQEIEIKFDLESGVRYRRGQSPAFTTIAPNLVPATEMNLYGNAQGAAGIDVRLVPTLEIRLYELVGGASKLEPYLDTGIALEGEFSRQSTGQHTTADYRFTDLYTGVGMDLGLRFDVSVFDFTLVGFPSSDSSEFALFVLVDERRFIDLPGILLDHDPDVSLPNYSHAIEVIATVDDRSDFNFNTFEPESVVWSIPSDAPITLIPDPGGDPYRVRLGTDNPQELTVKFAGHGRLGSFARQFEELTLQANDWSEGDVLSPGQTFKDCPDCPTMVVIPAGIFAQGSPDCDPESSDPECPQRQVNVPAFAMGQTTVTFAEWDACVADGGCTRNPSDNGWGRGSQPVINVNWTDAQEYVTWLSNKTGYVYRLPSESEWEYATRAGTTGRFNTGNCITTDQANFDGTRPTQGCPSSGSSGQPFSVASFAANSFGLYDTHGNVFEWVQDCLNPDYIGAPLDGSAWMSGNCSQAPLRGGAYSTDDNWVRSAYRFSTLRSVRFSNIGFRVARSVIP